MKIRWLKLFLVVFPVICLIHCTTVKKSYEITMLPKPKAISDAKLYDKLLENSPDIHTINIKKASFSFQLNDYSKNVTASIRIHLDSVIWMSINTALKIEVMRIICTPDSIKLVDRLHKEYFVREFVYIHEILGMEVDFYQLQSILTNSIFTLNQHTTKKSFIKSFKGKVKERKYVFYSKFYKKFQRKIKKKKTIKQKSKYRIYEQSIVIDPLTYRIVVNNITDYLAHQKVFIAYDDFKTNGDNPSPLFPHKIQFKFESDENILSANFKIRKIQFNNPVKTPFSIPRKYKLIP